MRKSKIPFPSNIRLKRKWASFAYDWCKKNLPESKYHDKFRKIILSNKSNKYFRGSYKDENNTITVYLKNNKSRIDICETVIHEWKHYQQNISEMYDKYIFYYGYEPKNHPYEVSAEKYAKKHSNKCFEWIKKNIK